MPSKTKKEAPKQPVMMTFRLRPEIAKELRDYCERTGVKQRVFVGAAIAAHLGRA